MLAAQVPRSIDSVVAEKNRQLDGDPDMTRLYRLLGSAPDWSPDDPRVVELADVVEHLRIRAVQSGEVEIGDGIGRIRSRSCWTRQWPSQRRSLDSCWRSSSNGGGVAGRGSNESPKGGSPRDR